MHMDNVATNPNSLPFGNMSDPQRNLFEMALVNGCAIYLLSATRDVGKSPWQFIPTNDKFAFEAGEAYRFEPQLNKAKSDPTIDQRIVQTNPGRTSFVSLSDHYQLAMYRAKQRGDRFYIYSDGSGAGFRWREREVGGNGWAFCDDTIYRFKPIPVEGFAIVDVTTQSNNLIVKFPTVDDQIQSGEYKHETGRTIHVQLTS